MNTNIIRTIFLALGAIFALLLIIAGVAGYLITGPVPTYAGAKVELSDEAAASLDDKIAELEQQIAQASAGEEVTLVITQEEATSKADQLAKAGELPLEMKHIQIHFVDGSIYGCARVDLLIDVWVAIQAKIGVEDGKPDITIESLHFGRLGIPRTLIENVMRALMKRMEERLEALPVELQDIAIGNGEITITLVKK
ncbi:MAG: hypothetical protein IBX36_04260 [Dehalococcoidia bacterium]|nr:hypothetical protein [Dehalococcoidia bacterium]